MFLNYFLKSIMETSIVKFCFGNKVFYFERCNVEIFLGLKGVENDGNYEIASYSNLVLAF
ncbi:hypothetical protein SAMN06297358_1315 [Pedobacter xixiisoli]|uniref:Uncharacterized protein n=1 Tax=Pedobacter xixiisoli TaxID=1476464 RepID=A0A285ZWB0_9SPHI|nr:hypothetical protein SAMN06297358_1315 [Pedobacter xixiisoli]